MKILFDKPFIKIPVRYDAPSIKFLISDQSGIIFEINAKYEADIKKVDHFYYAMYVATWEESLSFHGTWMMSHVRCPTFAKADRSMYIVEALQMQRSVSVAKNIVLQCILPLRKGGLTTPTDFAIMRGNTIFSINSILTETVGAI